MRLATLLTYLGAAAIGALSAAIAVAAILAADIHPTTDAPRWLIFAALMYSDPAPYIWGALFAVAAAALVQVIGYRAPRPEPDEHEAFPERTAVDEMLEQRKRRADAYLKRKARQKERKAASYGA
jgi:type VI protein secretion system component VasK